MPWDEEEAAWPPTECIIYKLYITRLSIECVTRVKNIGWAVDLYMLARVCEMVLVCWDSVD